MAPKKRAVKTVEEPVKEEKLNNVEKQFYELQIADLHKRLIGFKTQNEKIENENKELTVKIREMAEDRRDATA